MAENNEADEILVIKDDMIVLSLTSCKVDLQIQNFSALREERNICMRSTYFQFVDTKFCLYIVPKNQGISIRMQKQPSKSIRVEVKIGIKNVYDMVEEFIHKILDFESDNNKIFHLGFIDTTTFLDSEEIWIPDGSLTVSCSISLCDSYGTSDETLSTKNHCKLSKNFRDLFLSERNADVIIKVNENEFKAHRLILSARSSVFASMFDNDMTESQSGVVNIKDCDPEIFRDFLMFVYTEDYHCVTATIAPALYYMADKYAIQELKELCAKSMRVSVTVDTFCDIFYIAKVYDEPELAKYATDFFVKNMKDIIKTEKWLDFVPKNVVFLNELLMRVADFVDTSFVMV